MASVSQTLSALLKRSAIDDHDEVLKACNASLKQSKNDTEVQYIKAISLLKLDRYDDALRLLEGSGDVLKQRAPLERAYAFWKIGELDEAKSIAKSIQGDRGARHIEAQASYRLEHFSDAASVYHSLVGSHAPIDNEEYDLRINRGATDAQLEWQRQGDLVQKKKPGREDLDAFETAYNAACGSIARGELGQGEVLLRRAKDLCSALDELSDHEKAAEIIPICAQQLFVLSRLGKTDEAERIASDIALENIPDLSTRQIAQNNKIAARSKDVNPYLSHRLFENIINPPKTDRLFQFQLERIQQNRLAIDLAALKPTSVIKASSELLSDSSASISPHLNSISVLNAAAHAQNQLGKIGLKKILPLLERRPNDIGLVLTIIQLYVLTNNPGSAITVLESLLRRLSESQPPVNEDILFAPGLIATLVSLYTSQGRKSQTKASLAKAASYWRHKSKYPTSLLEAAGLALLDSTSPEHQDLATAIFSTLHASDPASRLATAGYVAAQAKTSPETSLPEADVLTPISRLIAGIDITALEAAGVPQLAQDQAVALATRKRALDERPKPAKKRVRKNRLPKDLDATKTPDPERWLPVRDRASYRPKGKKGRQKAAALTQGGTVEKGAEGLGTAGGGKAVNEGVIKSSGPAGGMAGKGKKKGKGKK